jgi:RNA polymerase sigma-70 factor (ECF subfamily)
MFINSSDLQTIYDTYHPKILRYLARLAGEEEGEDLAQEVFIRAGRALAGFRGESSLSTWLYCIATNLARDRMRSPSFRLASQEPTISDFDEDCEGRKGVNGDMTGENTTPIEQQLVTEEMGRCIRRYVEMLPDNYRAVLLLSDMEELSNKEIAEILGMTLETVKIRLHRARAILRERFVSTCEYYWLSELSWPAS